MGCETDHSMAAEFYAAKPAFVRSAMGQEFFEILDMWGQRHADHDIVLKQGWGVKQIIVWPQSSMLPNRHLSDRQWDRNSSRFLICGDRGTLTTILSLSKDGV